MMIGWITKVSFLLSVLLLPAQVILAAEALIDNENGTVTDSDRGVMWQQKDDGVERVWSDAVRYCEELVLAGHTDWELPKINMLEALIDSSNSPTISSVFSVKPSYYWSSSVSLNSSKSAKYVNFFYGNTYSYSKDNTYYAICARDAATVVIPPLTASIVIEASDQEAPFAISLASTTNGGEEPFFYEWDFSDGETSSLASPKHVFEVAGTYEIMLTVSDNGGAITVATEKLVLPAMEESIEKAADTILEDSLSPENEVVGGENLEEDAADISAALMPEQPEGSENTTTITGSNEEIDSPAIGQEIKIADVESKIEAEVEVETGSVLAVASVSSAFESKIDNADIGADIVIDPKTSVAVNSSDVQGDVSVEEKDGSITEESTTADAQGSIAEPLAVTIKTTDKEEGKADFAPGIKEPSKILEIFASVGQTPLTINSSGNGLLAYSLVNALGGDADWNKDGKVSARELTSYIPIAVDNLSGGKQNPAILTTGEDFFVCSETGSTYVLSVGVNMHLDNFMAQKSAAKDADAVRTGIEGKCLAQKTMILSGVLATRTEILQAMGKIGRLLTANDNLIFYYGGASEVSSGKLNMLAYDSIEGMTDFTGLFYDDIVSYFKGTNVRDMLFVIESGPLPAPVP